MNVARSLLPAVARWSREREGLVAVVRWWVSSTLTCKYFRVKIQIILLLFKKKNIYIYIYKYKIKQKIPTW